MPEIISASNLNVPAVTSGLQSPAAERWYALQTRSRSEKKVHGQLREKGLESFLPVLAEVRRWSDRRKSVEMPLFPGYVFVRMRHSGASRLAVLTTSGVAGLVGTPEGAISIPDQEIESIQMIVGNQVPFALFPFLRVGQRVRIRGGSLDGIEGILHSKNADQSVVVSVQLIQRSLGLQVSGFDLEMI